MLILDTDIVSLLHVGDPAIVQRVELTREAEEIVTTIITKAEVLRGRIEYMLKAHDREHFLKAQRLVLLSEARLAETPIIHLNDSALDESGSVQRDRRTRGIGRSDLLIAAIAMASDAILATRNMKHFSKVPRLRIANWKD
jgi:tRNA(fMet)-specific endonuclease VapC